MCPLCYIYFSKRHYGYEMRNLTAWGVKLLCSLVVRQQILVYLLSDGSRVNTLWLGVLSFSISGLCADISLSWCHWRAVVMLWWPVPPAEPSCPVMQGGWNCVPLLRKTASWSLHDDFNIITTKLPVTLYYTLQKSIQVMKLELD